MERETISKPEWSTSLETQVEIGENGKVSGLKNVRGIRGAIQVSKDEKEAILGATRELLGVIVDANEGLESEDIASIFFTATHDLVSVHPALAARQLGWVHVPLLCAQEIPVPGSLPRVVRVLIHWNTNRAQARINHVYLGEAARLRPDLNIPKLSGS